MSLYRYVGAKDELLALMMDRAFQAWVLRIPLGGPPILPNQVAWFERGLSCLRGTTLSEPEKLSALLLVNGYVRNEALLAADLLSGARAAGISMQDVMQSYKTQLSSLIDPDRFPALCAMVGAGVFDGIDEPDADFEFGLERILDGLAARMDEPAGVLPSDHA
jgi:AcrR family transcriptional regulator